MRFFLDIYPLAHVAVAAAGLIAYVLVTHLGRQRRHPSAAVAWVLSMIAFPYITLPLFLLLGTRKLVRPPRDPRPVGAAHDFARAPTWATRLSAGLSLPPPRDNRRVALLDDGQQALDALIDLIEGARHTLDLCVFLFADDDTGRRVATALIDCARRGCRVRVVLDAVGGLRMSRALRRALTHAHIDVRRFMPLLHDPRRGRGNLRNHRKLAIADGERAWSGGRNIADEYFLDRPGHPAWHDLSFVVEGATVHDAMRVFERDWKLAGGKSDGVADSPTTQASDVPGAAAQLLPSGPDQADDTIYAFLLTAVYQAQARILAVTPYFVPDDAFLQALTTACRRGVRFTLLLPARSNHRLADWARERSLRELAIAGADIQLLPEMVHAKLVIVDNAVAVCGSANLDGRSLFLNYELSTAFYDRAEIDHLVQWHEREAGRAHAYVVRPPSLPRDIFEGLVRAVGFQL
jgi:cardiolipin synthase